MGLEFKIQDSDSESELKIDVYNDDWKGLQFTIVGGNDKPHGFDSIGLGEILELGIMVNHRIGFEMFDIRSIQRAIDEESKN